MKINVSLIRTQAMQEFMDHCFRGYPVDCQPNGASPRKTPVLTPAIQMAENQHQASLGHLVVFRNRYWQTIRLNFVVIALLALGLSVSGCAPSLEDGIKAGEENNYDKEETIMLQVAERADPHGYEARKGLAFIYKYDKPDPKKELYWLIKVVEHPQHDNKDGLRYSPGLKEERIARFFQDGLGTVKDQEQACVWYEKAYKAGNEKTIDDLAQHCDSNTIADPDVQQAMKGVRVRRQEEAESKTLELERARRYEALELERARQEEAFERMQRSRD